MARPPRHPTPPPLDVDRATDVLNRHGVDYTVIGGVATVAHGNPRATFDLDLVASHAKGNLRRLAAALAELNAEPAGVDAHLLDVDPTDPDQLANGANWTLHTDAGRVDFMSSVPGGRPYDEIRSRAVRIEPPGGPSFLVVGLDDLIRMKRAAGRPKDRADIAALAGVPSDDPDEPDDFAPPPSPGPGRPGKRPGTNGTFRCGSTATRDGRPCRRLVPVPGRRCALHR